MPLPRLEHAASARLRCAAGVHHSSAHACSLAAPGPCLLVRWAPVILDYAATCSSAPIAGTARRSGFAPGGLGDCFGDGQARSALQACTDKAAHPGVEVYDRWPWRGSLGMALVMGTLWPTTFVAFLQGTRGSGARRHARMSVRIRLAAELARRRFHDSAMRGSHTTMSLFASAHFTWLCVSCSAAREPSRVATLDSVACHASLLSCGRPCGIPADLARGARDGGHVLEVVEHDVVPLVEHLEPAAVAGQHSQRSRQQCAHAVCPSHDPSGRAAMHGCIRPSRRQRLYQA